MSFEIDASTNKISLTRGDSARFKVDLTCNGEPYVFGEGDSLKFTVKKKSSDEEVALTKTVVGTPYIELESDDTKSLAFGVSYKYEVELTTSSGYVQTITGLKAPTLYLAEELG